MKQYILKLKTDSTTNYSVYDGTTALTDAKLGTLFTAAGSAYFNFDFNSLTPSATDAITIVDSNDTAVITNTGLTDTIAENKDYKGTWSASATTFDTFATLSGVAMDEAQISDLMGKIKEGKSVVLKYITEDVYAWNFFGGDDAVGKIFLVRNDTDADKFISLDTTSLARSYTRGIYVRAKSDAVCIIFRCRFVNNSYSYRFFAVKGVATSPSSEPSNMDEWKGVICEGAYARFVNNPQVTYFQQEVVNNLTSTYSQKPLSAAQGKVLNDKITSATVVLSNSEFNNIMENS